MEITDEKEPGFYEDGDLRIWTKGKYILAYIDWFDSRKNREISVNREFIEEIGLNDEFNKILIKESKVEFIKQITEQIHFSKYFKADEIKIFDIFDVEIPVGLLKEIVNQDSIILVGKEDIERECVHLDGKSRKIAMTAKYTL